MPREEKVKIYAFDELSKEAKERAINAARDRGYGFHDDDSRWLTESFQERLKEKGFNDGVTVNWSLGHCQGDGVCFEGSIDPEIFLKKNKEIKGYSDLADKVGISVKNSESHRYCHWNSMQVYVEGTWGSWEDLVPRDLWEEWQDWEVERTKLERHYEEEVRKVREARQAPIREWERLMESYKGRTGVLDWTPDLPEKPEPLDISFPPEPDYPEKPGRFVRAEEAAKKKEERLNLKVNELEEELKEWVADMSRELEKDGYAEIEYRDSDESIAEVLSNKDEEYTEEGEVW